MSPENIVIKQVVAYNSRNIEDFAACHHPEVELYSLGESEPFVKGREQLYKRYNEIFDQSPELHTEIVQRMVMGNTVIDKEIITGRAGVNTQQFIAIYEIKEGLIATAHFVREVEDK